MFCLVEQCRALILIEKNMRIESLCRTFDAFDNRDQATLHACGGATISTPNFAFVGIGNVKAEADRQQAVNRV